MSRVCYIRDQFVEELGNGNVVPGKTSDGDTVEIIGVSFIADEPTIFGSVDHGYVDRELEWYLSQSLNVNDIPPPVPKIWRQVATPEGFVNSNYGWMIFSKENGSQYDHCAAELQSQFGTRRASMIYTRPSMQWEFNKGGMSDFVCTDAVHAFVRRCPTRPNIPLLEYVVFMRSNDAVFGYKNDYAWHAWVQRKLVSDLANTKLHLVGLERGAIHWNAATLHVYRRHFSLIESMTAVEDVNL